MSVSWKHTVRQVDFRSLFRVLRENIEPLLSTLKFLFTSFNPDGHHISYIKKKCFSEEKVHLKLNDYSST